MTTRIRKLDRRQFLQTSAASCLLATLGIKSEAAASEILDSGGTLRFTGANYDWDWSKDTDRFRILNQEGSLIAGASLQPIVIVRQPGQGAPPKALTCKLENHQVAGNRAVWTYADVGGSGRVTVAWRFDERCIWIEPVIYESSRALDVVSLKLFAESSDDAVKPALDADDLLMPGICESEGISPIVNSNIGLTLRTSLGRSGNGVTQQWALPCHYFAGFQSPNGGTPKKTEPSEITRAFCCGLSELPNTDVFVELRAGRSNLEFDYRGDLWEHMRGPGNFTLGACLLWTFAPNYYEAIRNYYRGLVAAGMIREKVNSARKNAALLAPQWCTWGEQLALRKEGTPWEEGSQLTQARLEKCYQDLKNSGLQASMLSIDDGWEGKFGSLEHSAERLPHFEQFLGRVRADGLRIGMWAAFMRCADPAELGLTPEQMLRRSNGKPYITGSPGYYILDFTRPEVEKILQERSRRFVRRYQPDLVKFDFGYEIPAIEYVAPHDMRWAGERMLAKGLDVVVNSMREVNPDIAVMYYQLSPLFADYLDLHSPDDLFMAKGEYDLEANRRLFFSGLCGEFGMPTYGSSGYDWASAPEIWFDSVAIGTLGSLATFGGTDDAGGTPTPRCLAKYNGLAHLVRPSNQFTIRPLDPVYDSVTRGAHASSWVRLEAGQPTLLALRSERLDGGRGVSEFPGIASTTASVVVASKTQDALGRTTRLAVVPWGEGQLTLHHTSGASFAEVTEHDFGGRSRSRHLQVREGVLAIPLHENAVDGTPLEWIEIKMVAKLPNG